MSGTNSIQISFDKGSFDKADLPHEQGLYCIYRCKHVFRTLPYEMELRYIGKAEDLHNRLDDHEKEQACQKELTDGETLYFTWALASDKDMLRLAEAALIHHFRPYHNSDFKDHFPFDDTDVTVTDPLGTLTGSFNVKCTEGKPVKIL